MPTAVVATAAFLLLFAGTASAGSTAGNPDPKTLVLRLSDVPAGFERTTGSHVSNAQAARAGGLPLSRYVGWGRIDGYVVKFSRKAFAGSVRNGVLGIDSTATLYRAASGAHSAFIRWAATAAESSQGKITPVVVGTRLGDESRAFRVETTNGGVHTLEFVVGWRAGRFDGVVTTSGTAGRLDSQSAFDLAKRQQLRMRSAG